MLVLLGLSHHNAPIALREQLACAESRLPEALACLVGPEIIREVALISTCNRVECYAVADGPDASQAVSALCESLASFHRLPVETFRDHLVTMVDTDAAAHLFRVASGLDSLAIGETQILGQVRAALDAAQNASTTGPLLSGLFQRALAAGKRVQSETMIGKGAFSIGRAAVDLARSIFADLSRARVMILGAGKMSELTARHLVENGVKVVLVANRTFDRAAEMAGRLGGQAIQYDRFAEELASVDIVIASTGAPHAIVRKEMLAPLVRKRRGRPLFLIDIAVPRDIEPDVGDLENVFLYNIDHLESVVAAHATERAGESGRASAILVAAVADYESWCRFREVAPVISDLRTHLSGIADSRLEIIRMRLPGLEERELKVIEAQLRAMADEVAMAPINALRTTMAAADTDEYGAARLIELTRSLYGLTSTSESENKP